MNRYTRISWLLGDGFKALGEARVLVCGLGGVGGVCADALFRSGFTNLTLIDMDKFETTNQNRQIHSENVGKSKAIVFKEIYNVTAYEARICEEFLKDFEIQDFDIIIDALDDMDAKIALAKCINFKSQIFLASCGAAKRVDARCIKVADVFKTHADKLAKKYRYELKRAGLSKACFDVVFSTEEPKCEKLGSFMGVTASFGLMLASLALQKYLAKVL